GRHHDRHVARELPEYLPASPARRRGLVRAGHDRDRPELPNTLGESFPDRHPLGADGQAVGRVFDVATAPDLPRIVLDRGADGEPAAFRAGVAALFRRRLAQPIFRLPRESLDHVFSTAAAIFGTEAWRSLTNRAPTRLVVSSTSTWFSGFLRIPVAMFVIVEIPTTRTPMWRRAMASGTVDIPTASAPSFRHIRISAGVS